MPRTEVDLAKLEDDVAGLATKRLREQIEDLTRRSIAMWDGLDESARPMARTLITNGLRKILDDEDLFFEVTEWIEEGVSKAYIEGIEQAARDAGRNYTDFLSPIPRDLLDLGRETAEKARQEVEEAVRMVGRAEEIGDVEDALQRARRSVTRVESGARWGVNRALAAGTTEVATATSTSRLWVGERDACVQCLAYIGHVAESDEPFPAGLTFGKKPLSFDPVPDPPLHPRCRCRIRLWRSEWDAPGTSTPEALRREAVRSVLRGWSLPSESERVRLDAAERLLKRGGLDMPKSVQDYARKAIKRGHFPRGRDFPRPGDERTLTGTKVKRAKIADAPKKGDAIKAKNVFDVLPRKSGDLSTPKRPALSDSYTDAAFGWGTGDAERNGDVRSTNPNYYEGPEWGVNCQRVAVAYELRRRGYLVEAEPNYKDSRSKQYSWDALAALWRRPERWLMPNMQEAKPNAPGAIRIPAGTAIWDRPKTRDELLVEVATWPPGARGWLGGAWIGQDSAHIWNVEIGEDGSIHFIDAQPRIAGKSVLDYLSRIKPGTFFLMRVDDLEPEDDEMVRMVRPAD